MRAAQTTLHKLIAVIIILTVWGLVYCPAGFSRPQTPLGLPMKASPVAPVTNLVPTWHTIQVEPAPGVPAIHYYDKLNPVWWFKNADDPKPPAWYQPTDPFRNLQWSFRNPFHNLDHYVIGIADKSFRRSGHYPERNSDPSGRWDLEISRHKWLVFPFISYKRHGWDFYFGWREHGAFGIKLNFSKRSMVP